jgi:hypothetical protein
MSFFNYHKDKLSVDEINNVQKRNILKQKIIDEITNAKKKYTDSFKNNYHNKNEKKKTEIYKNASKI